MGHSSLTIANGVATWVIEWPATRNAIDVTLINELNEALDVVEKRHSGARAMVMTGRDQVFCSGVNLKSVDLTSPETRQRAHLRIRSYLDPLMLRLSSFRFPLVAAVNGAAVGAGMSLAVASDIIVCGDNAYLLPSFARLGLVPDAGMTFHLARRIGGGRALSALMLAEPIAAKTALEWGLAYAVVPAQDVVLRAQEMAQRLSSGACGVLGQIRALQGSTFEHSLREQLAAERWAQEMLRESRECVEGVRAFFERQEPHFSEQ